AWPENADLRFAGQNPESRLLSRLGASLRMGFELRALRGPTLRPQGRSWRRSETTAEGTHLRHVRRCLPPYDRGVPLTGGKASQPDDPTSFKELVSVFGSGDAPVVDEEGRAGRIRLRRGLTERDQPDQRGHEVRILLGPPIPLAADEKELQECRFLVGLPVPIE